MIIAVACNESERQSITKQAKLAANPPIKHELDPVISIEASISERLESEENFESRNSESVDSY